MTWAPGFISSYDQARAQAHDDLDRALDAIRRNTAGDSEVDQAVTVAAFLDMLEPATLKDLLHAAIDRFLEVKPDDEAK